MSSSVSDASGITVNGWQRMRVVSLLGWVTQIQLNVELVGLMGEEDMREREDMVIKVASVAGANQLGKQ